MNAVMSLILALALSPSAKAQVAGPSGIQVHTHTAGPLAYDGNAFWLESDSGLVLIDALLLKSEARLLAATMKATGKPLVGIILTHPHLDHFGGIRTVLSVHGKVPVYATQATVDGIKPTYDQAMAGGWPQALGADFDQNPYLPETIVASGATLELAGMRFLVRDYGPIEARNNSVIHNLDLNVLFTGDATVAHGTVYVGEGHSGKALEMLPRLAADFPNVARVYSGHYGPMQIKPLVAQNIEEIRYYRGVVRTLLADPANRTEKGELTNAARLQGVRAIASHAREESTYGLSPMMMGQMNLAGLEPELIAAQKGRPISETRVALATGLGRLGFLPGRWTGLVSVVPAPAIAAGPPAARPEAPPTRIEVAFRPGAGGSYLEGDARFAGFGYRMVVSYDIYQKTYRTSVVDDASGLVDVFEGTLDASGSLVQTNVRSGTHYLQEGDRVHTRLIFTPLENGLWRWAVESSTDLGATWRPMQAFEAEKRIP